jgi:hypothetical protein
VVAEALALTLADGLGDGLAGFGLYSANAPVLDWICAVTVTEPDPPKEKVTWVSWPTVSALPGSSTCGCPGWPNWTDSPAGMPVADEVAAETDPAETDPADDDEDEPPAAPLAEAGTIRAGAPSTCTSGQLTSVLPLFATAPMTSALPELGSTTTHTLFTLSAPVLPDPEFGFTCVEAELKPAPQAVASGATVSRTAAVARPARPRREGADRRVVLGEWRLLTVGLAPWRNDWSEKEPSHSVLTASGGSSPGSPLKSLRGVAPGAVAPAARTHVAAALQRSRCGRTTTRHSPNELTLERGPVQVE